MIQINLTLSVSLDASDLTALDKLAAIGRGIRLFAETTEATQSRTEQPPASPSVDLRADSALSANPPPPLATAQNAPKRSAKPARPAKIPARERTPVLPPIPAATMNGERKGDAELAQRGAERTPEVSSVDLRESSVDSVTLPHPSNRLPFAEFDRLVRAEMKRLAMDGRLPGHKLWDSERAPGLPTLPAVILRYKADGLVGLAEILGLEPPLSVQKKVSEA